MSVKNLMIAALACTAVGCVSSGTKVTQSELSDFHVGTTTEAQIVGELGQPNAVSTLADGTKTDTYVHTAAHPTAVSFIPVVGLLAGGAKGTSQSETFNFDAHGILKSMSSSSSQTNVNTGLANQR